MGGRGGNRAAAGAWARDPAGRSRRDTGDVGELGARFCVAVDMKGGISRLLRWR